jgi:hypothetical protein
LTTEAFTWIDVLLFYWLLNIETVQLKTNCDGLATLGKSWKIGQQDRTTVMPIYDEINKLSKF